MATPMIEMQLASCQVTIISDGKSCRTSMNTNRILALEYHISFSLIIYFPLQYIQDHLDTLTQHAKKNAEMMQIRGSGDGMLFFHTDKYGVSHNRRRAVKESETHSKASL